PQAAAAALADLPEDDLPGAREAAARWRGKNAAALARHLSRKGFSRRAIFAVLAENDENDERAVGARRAGETEDLAAEPPDDLD
ncbi:MAG TPA: hypothetical protein VMW75_00680, partial [Thermoanaerobaculia bacterium]|nr:hypothetical protein [Thermoanaerobaculia bacterium]